MEASKSGAGAAPIGLSALRACSSRTDNATTRCVRRSRSDAAALPKAAKLLEMRQARRPKKTPPRTISRELESFLNPGREFRKSKKTGSVGLAGVVFEPFHSHSCCKIASGVAHVSQQYHRTSLAAQIGRRAASSHLLSKGCALPSPKASNRSLAQRWASIFSSRNQAKPKYDGSPAAHALHDCR